MNNQETALLVIALTFGVIAGFIIAWLIAKVRYSALVPRGELEDRNRQIAAMEADTRGKEQMIQGIKQELVQLRENNVGLAADVSAKQTTIAALEKRLADGKKELDELNSRFNEEFRKIANEILVNNSDRFGAQTSDRLKTILEPLKDQINKFEKKIDDSRTEQIKESTSLKEQISQLTDLNQQMSAEAKNLTSALKSESKTRGNWGEMILETILEKSGLVKDEHYEIQKTVRDDEGRMMRPDVIIHMPEKRHLVIDSKVSLVAYEQYCSESDPAARERRLKEHFDAVKSHITNLGSKKYQSADGITPPDFVLMFIPIEPAFSVALEYDRSIFQTALDRNVVMLTPSTLIPTLRIIHNIWRQESQNKNAQEIAATGGRLYDKLAGFIEDMNGIDTNLTRTRDSFDSAMKKLSSGRGNVLGMAEKMKAMGAKATKRIAAAAGDEEDERE